METLRLIVDYCFKHLDLDEIELGVLPGNQRAIVAYLKSGFSVRRIDRIKKDDGTSFDNLIMSVKKQ